MLETSKPNVLPPPDTESDPDGPTKGLEETDSTIEKKSTGRLLRESLPSTGETPEKKHKGPCSLCGKIHKKKRDKDRCNSSHEKHLKDIEWRRDEGADIECMVCGKMFWSQKNHDQHMRLHEWKEKKVCCMNIESHRTCRCCLQVPLQPCNRV